MLDTGPLCTGSQFEQSPTISSRVHQSIAFISPLPSTLQRVKLLKILRQHSPTQSCEGEWIWFHSINNIDVIQLDFVSKHDGAAIISYAATESYFL